jgi:hypothetical protein
MGTRKTAELIRLLIDCRGQDPDNRQAWDAAKQSVHRWLNGWSTSIREESEARCLAVKLGQEPGYLIIPKDVRQSRLAEDLTAARAEIDELRRRLEAVESLLPPP